jgi:hypothetical protein
MTNDRHDDDDARKEAAVTTKQWILFLLPAAMLSILAGCGGGSTFNVQNPPPPPPSAPSIVFQPPPAGSMLISTTMNLTAVVSNDPSSAGVDWSITCQNKGNCGSFSATNPVVVAHTASGTAVTYTPPSTLPGNSQTVDITAFATADHDQNVVAPVTITAFASNLAGSYVLQAQGVDINGGPNYQFAGVVVLDGNGDVVNGEQTINFFDMNPQINAFVTRNDIITGGNYFLGADGRGTMTINTNDGDIGYNNGNAGNGVETFSLVFLSSSQALIAQADFGTALTGTSASGTMDLQTSTAAPTAGYAFVVSGSDFTTGSPVAYGGVLNIDSPNNISGTGSVSDQDLAGIVIAGQRPSGTLSNFDSFGAFTLNLNVPGFSTTNAFQFKGYIVDGTHVQLIESDNTSGAGIGSTAGIAIGQGSATGLLTSFHGTYVFGIVGEDLSVNVPSTGTSAGLFTAVDNGDGTGNLTNGFTDTFLQANSTEGTAGAQMSGTFTGTFTDAPEGTARARSFFDNIQPHPPGGFHADFIFYQTGNGNPALVLASANNDQDIPLFLGAGIAYPQSTAPLAFGGPYGFSFTQQNGSENDGTARMTAIPASETFSGSADSTVITAGDTTASDHSFIGNFSSPDCFVGPLSNGCFAGSFANSTGSAFTGNNPNNYTFAADFYMIDAGHGFFVETDLLNPGTGQVSFGYYAARTPACVGCP